MKRFLASAVLAVATISTPVLAQPALSPPPAFMFTSLETADLAKTEAFYGALGLKKMITLTPAGGPVEKYGYNFSGDSKSAEPMLILIHYKTPKPEQNHSTGAKIGIRVADAKAAMARLRAGGFNVSSDASARPGGMVQGIARDPDGVIVEVTQLNLK